jgi:hypothetical protein
MFVPLVALAGIVIDGGARLLAAENAAAVAQEAARAGAGMVNRSAAYAHGAFDVGQQQAITAARAYLAGAGYQGTVTAAGPFAIRVAVRVTTPSLVLSIIGIGPATVTKTATADLVTAVTGAGANTTAGGLGG